MKNVLTIHLFHGSYVVLRVRETDEAVAFALVRTLVSHDFGFREGREVAEVASK